MGKHSDGFCQVTWGVCNKRSNLLDGVLPHICGEGDPKLPCVCAVCNTPR